MNVYFCRVYYAYRQRIPSQSDNLIRISTLSPHPFSKTASFRRWMKAEEAVSWVGRKFGKRCEASLAFRRRTLESSPSRYLDLGVCQSQQRKLNLEWSSHRPFGLSAPSPGARFHHYLRFWAYSRWCPKKNVTLPISEPRRLDSNGSAEARYNLFTCIDIWYMYIHESPWRHGIDRSRVTRTRIFSIGDCFENARDRDAMDRSSASI